MRKDQKQKLNKLNFYIIKDDYINYLSDFDNHIAYNKKQKRPYIGVLIIVHQHYYFAPLFSPKPKHMKYKENLTIIIIKDMKNKNNLVIIRFSDMIPVPQECVHLLDIKSKSYGYKRLLSAQYSYINKTENRKIIFMKSEKLYNIEKKKKKSKMSEFYKNLCCDFKLLEQKSLKYKNDLN